MGSSIFYVIYLNSFSFPFLILFCWGQRNFLFVEKSYKLIINIEMYTNKRNSGQTQQLAAYSAGEGSSSNSKNSSKQQWNELNQLTLNWKWIAHFWDGSNRESCALKVYQSSRVELIKLIHLIHKYLIWFFFLFLFFFFIVWNRLDCWWSKILQMRLLPL